MAVKDEELLEILYDATLIVVGELPDYEEDFRNSHGVGEIDVIEIIMEIEEQLEIESDLPKSDSIKSLKQLFEHIKSNIN